MRPAGRNVVRKSDSQRGALLPQPLRGPSDSKPSLRVPPRSCPDVAEQPSPLSPPRARIRERHGVKPLRLGLVEYTATDTQKTALGNVHLKPHSNRTPHVPLRARPEDGLRQGTASISPSGMCPGREEDMLAHACQPSLLPWNETHDKDHV